jgi:hypothetical protein
MPRQQAGSGTATVLSQWIWSGLTRLIRAGQIDVAAGDVMGGDGRQRTAGPQRVGGLGDPQLGVDPVERGRRQDHVERLGGQWPVLERGGDDLDLGEAGKVSPGDGRQIRAQLDGDNAAAALSQRHRRLPGAGADLQQPASPIAWAGAGYAEVEA